MRTSKLHAVLAAVAVVGIACPGPDDMTAPVTEWEAALTGANEIPAITTTGTATGDFSLTSGGDSLNYTLTIGTALVGTATQAHIHTGAPNANGAIAIWLCDSAGNPGPGAEPLCGTGQTAGQVLATGKVAITAAQLNTLRAYGFYANIHSNGTGMSGGEVRGQIRNVGTVS